MKEQVEPLKTWVMLKREDAWVTMVFMIVNTNPVGLKISGGKHVEEEGILR